eukprot:5600458-Amphidinium_carterae.1
MLVFPWLAERIGPVRCQSRAHVRCKAHHEASHTSLCQRVGSTLSAISSSAQLCATNDVEVQ